ncbi:rhodanese-like domain-containing protein [Desulfosarcina sp.]|uniref:rhodanese-like domain-containing protein n=1 Tax=Desulfosarcina sp. TaxID=2027861 RepID=UPI0039708B65
MPLIGLIPLLSIARVDADPISADLIKRITRTQDTDLVVSAQSLIARVQNGEKLLLIDIRSAPEYAALHIPGAINLSLHFIKTKPHLKSAPIVLVDQGLSSQRLSPACRELRNQGFDLRILDGGMHAWRSHGGPMAGDPVRQMAYDRLAPADFFLEKNDPGHIVCDASAAHSPASVQLMPYAIHLPLAGDPGDLTTQVANFKATHTRKGSFTVLVVNENGKGYPNFRSAFDRAGLKNVFYLDGGIKAYGEYLEGLSQSWRPRSERLVMFSPCGGCGEKE